jgi:hypothetical protein
MRHTCARTEQKHICTHTHVHAHGQKAPKSGQERSKTTPRLPQEHFKRTLRPPKSTPRPNQDLPRAPQTPQELSKRPPGPPKTPLRPPKTLPSRRSCTVVLQVRRTRPEILRLALHFLVPRSRQHQRAQSTLLPCCSQTRPSAPLVGGGGLRAQRVLDPPPPPQEGSVL